MERLADDLAAADAAHFGCGGCAECEDRPTLHAQTVLASPWLAVHDAEVAARALREAADECDRDAETCWCGSSTCAQNNRITARWLRARADRVAGHAQEDE